MHITPKRNKQIHMYSLCGHMYSFSGQILDRVRNNPYLGLKIANDLKWNTNIKLTVSKVSITLGMLRRNLKIIPRDIKSTAYISMVRSILEYGSIVWDPYLQRDIQCIEKVQRRAARFIISDYKTNSPGFMTQTLKDIGLPPVQERRLYNSISFFHNFT